MSRNLDEMFASGAADLVGTLQLPPAERLRSRSSRRHLHAALAVGAAAGVTLAGSTLAITLIQQRAPDVSTHLDRTPFPTRPVPSAQPVPSGSPVPSGRPTPDGTAAPTGTADPRQRKSNPPGLPVVRMPHEGEPGWVRVDDPQAVAGWSSCRVGDDPTRLERTAGFTMTGPGNAGEEQHSPTRFTLQLFLYGSETAAQKAFGAVQENLRTCGWNNPGLNEGTYIGHRFVNPNYPNLRAEQLHGFQQGKAIFLMYQVIGGAGMTSGDNAAVPYMREHVCTVLKECAS